MDGQLAAVRARLETVAAGQDLSCVLDESAAAEALALASALTDAGQGDPRAAEGRYLLGWLRWFRSQALAGAARTREREAAMDNFLPLFAVEAWPLSSLPAGLLPELARRATQIATSDISVDARISLWRRVLHVTGEQDPDHPGRLMALSLALHERSDFAADTAGLTEAVGLARQALHLTPQASPLLPMYLASLVSMLTALSERTGLPDVLDEAVETGRLAVAAVRDDDPVRGAIRSLFAVALLKQAARTGSIAAIDELVGVGRAALASAPPDRGHYWWLLGVALQARFERTGAPADLDEAIDAHREAVAAVSDGDPARPAWLANLSMSLRLKFASTGEAGALSEAVAAASAAVDAATGDTPDRGTCLMSLGLALLSRFERFGSQEDLTDAVRLTRAAVDASDENGADRPTRLSNLSVALQALDEHTGAPGALAEAVSAARRALDLTPAADISRPGRESNLAIALKDLFERTGARDALEEAIALGDSSLRDVPRDHPARAFFLSNAAAARSLRFRHAGALADLDAAVRLGRESVNTAPPGNPDRCVYLSNLGGTLQVRAERTGSTSDLEASIRVQREALEHTPADHRDRGRRLANFAVALKVHAMRTASDEELDAAISTARAAADTMPRDHADRVVALTNLGSALRERFTRSGSPGDIAAAIKAHRDALAGIGQGRPTRGLHLSNCANALLARARHAGSLDDMNEAISMLERAADLSAGNEPDRAVYLSNLGNALRARGELTGAAGDRRAAIATYTEAVETEIAAPSVRVAAAATMAEILTDTGAARHAGVLATAVELLPRLAGRYLTRSDQQEALSGLSGLIADAAGLTLMDERLPPQHRAERALRLIEAGRGVIHSQVLDIRSDLSELRRADDGLARRFTELRDQIDLPPAQDETLPRPGAHMDPYELSQEFDALLDRIRRLPGLASFAALPALDELRRDAAVGPVVTFNVCRHRSDALLLTPDGVRAVPLPGLAVGVIAGRLAAFHAALTDAAARNYAARSRAQKLIGEVLAWLWDAAAAPVLDALGLRERPVDGTPARLWWAPGGLLGLLPIHAAGYHDGPPDAVLDHVVSSYTPTIRALRYARQKASGPGILARSAARTPRSLVVAMPTTPAAGEQQPPPPLRYARDEASAVAGLLPGPVVLISKETGDAGAPDRVTRDAVLARLADCPVAHFACHGVTDPRDPSLSRLLLQDHDVAPLTVASLASTRLDACRLAYLSACDTAHQDGTRLLDEAIHLASAFQLAGFPHVIATLWQADDSAAVEVAGKFYGRLAAGGERATLESGHAAVALHHAVNELRRGVKYRAKLSAWAPYIHVGA